MRSQDCGPLIIVATAPAGIGHHGPPPVSWDNRGVFVHHAFQSFTHLPETAARTPSYLLLRINQGIYNRNIVTIPFAFNGDFHVLFNISIFILLGHTQVTVSQVKDRSSKRFFS